MKTLSKDELMNVNGGGVAGFLINLAVSKLVDLAAKELYEAGKMQKKGYYVTTDSSGNHWYSHGGGNIYIDNDRGEQEGH